MPQKPQCARCGDVIGAYEPMILVVDGEPRKTSAFAEQAKAPHTGEHYHTDCYPQ